MPPWTRTILPVVVFVIFACVRSYLECVWLTPHAYFGYYIAWHHVLWLTNVALVAILLTHLFTGVAVTRLLWLMYLGIVMLIPVGYAVAVQEPLCLTYLQGSARDIALHIATFCMTFEQNRPLTIELIVIFAGMILLGRHYGLGWTRAALLALAMHLCGNVLAIHWMSPSADMKPVLVVPSSLSYHMQIAVVSATLLTGLVIVLTWRAGGFSGLGRMRWMIAWFAVLGWLTLSVAMHASDWYTATFDQVAPGIVSATACALATLTWWAHRNGCGQRRWLAVWAAWMVQLAVAGPIILQLHAPLRATPEFEDRNPASPDLIEQNRRPDGDFVEVLNAPFSLLRSELKSQD